MKKILALVVAALLVLSMTVALADTTAISGGIATLDAGLDAISFKTSITNEDDYTPATKYTYTIAAADDATTSTVYKNGIDGVVAFTADTANSVTVSGNVATVTWAANDAKPEKVVTIDLTAPTGVQPGVYRYYITQSEDTAEQTEIGLATTNEYVKALDLYVEWNADKSALIITNAVLSEDEKTIDADGTTYTHETKVDEYTHVYGTGPDGENYTYTLSKAVSGSMADTNQEFNFTLQLSYTEGADGDTTLSGMAFDLLKGTSTTPIAQPTVGGEAVEFTLKDGESVTMTLPKSVTVTAKETYANTEQYQITSSADNFDSTKTVTKIETAVTEDTTGTVGTMATTDATMAYTNTLNNISPTGIVLRFAPYFAMLAGGMLLVLLAIKRRKSDED